MICPAIVKDVMQKKIAEMAAYEVVPPKEYQTIKRRYLSPKRCYEQAYKYIMTLEGNAAAGARVVYGYYTWATKSIEGLSKEDRWVLLNNHGHAWVEIPGNIVYDGVYKRFYSKPDYYRVVQVEKDSEYTKAEINKLVIENNYIGRY